MKIVIAGKNQCAVDVHKYFKNKYPQHELIGVANSDDDVNGDGFLDNEIFVSGLVTPGVRGNEATWKVLNIDNYPGSKVSIYDRNGLLVYKKINYQNNWAGTFQQTGDLLPAGSYYYIIEISENDKFIQGWLYLTY